jgi:hypothetical protein
MRRKKRRHTCERRERGIVDAFDKVIAYADDGARGDALAKERPFPLHLVARDGEYLPDVASLTIVLV